MFLSTCACEEAVLIQNLQLHDSNPSFAFALQIFSKKKKKQTSWFGMIKWSVPEIGSRVLDRRPLVQTNDRVEARAGCGQGKRPTTAAKLQVHHHHRQHFSYKLVGLELEG